MGRTKRKKPKKTGKRSFIPVLLVFTFLLCGVGVLTVYFFAKDNNFNNTLVFEEIYNTRESLKVSIRRIDKTLFEVFYVNKVPDQNIRFLAVGPRQKSGQVWEFTDLAVRCPDLETCVKLEKDIVQYLERRSPACLKICEKNRNQIVCKIWVNGFLTHQISLLVSKKGTPPLTRKPKVALIIDDLGYDLRLAREFINCQIPLSFSVLPFAPYTKKIAQEAVAKGHDILLHLPMEPRDYPRVRPGPGALLLNMDTDQIRKIVEGDICQVPGVCGVNNHMGSLFTEDREKMLVVLQDLARQGLFYVDSRTSSSSVGYILASELGIPCAERDIFVDNDLDGESIAMQIERLIKIGRRTGRAIGIAHPHKETLRVIKELMPEINSQVKLVPVSELVTEKKESLN